MVDRRSRSLAGIAAPLAASVAVFALHVGLALRIPGPGVLADEAGYLGNARLLAGALGLTDAAPWPMDDASFYPAGYSVVLAPLHLLTEDPRTLYALVVVVNALLMAAAIPLLAAVARRLGAGSTAAWAGAVVAGLAPALAVHSAIAWAEPLVVLLWPATILALHAALARPDSPGRWCFGAAAVGLAAAHNRFLPLALLAVVLLVATGLRRLLTWTVVAVNAGVVVAGLLGLRAMEGWLLDRRWSGATRTSGEGGDLLEPITDPGRWPHLAAQVVGQGWYLLAVSLGLAGVGAVVVALPDRLGWSVPAPALGRRRPAHASPAAAEPTATEPTATEPTDGADEEAQDEAEHRPDVARAWVGWWAVGGVLAMVGIGAAFFGHDLSRADQVVYGRYAEPLALPLVTVGVAALWPGRRGPVGGSLLAVSAVLAVVGGGAVAVLRDQRLFELPWNTVNTAGLASLVEGGGSQVMFLALGATTAAALAVAALALAGQPSGPDPEADVDDAPRESATGASTADEPVASGARSRASSATGSRAVDEPVASGARSRASSATGSSRSSGVGERGPWGPWAAAGLAAAVSVGLAVGAPGAAAEERLRIYDGWSLPDDVAALGADAICFDTADRSVFAFWSYPFWLPDVALEPVDFAVDGCEHRYVVAAPGAPALLDVGAVVAVVDPHLPQVVWDLQPDGSG